MNITCILRLIHIHEQKDGNIKGLLLMSDCNVRILPIRVKYTQNLELLINNLNILRA